MMLGASDLRYCTLFELIRLRQDHAVARMESQSEIGRAVLQQFIDDIDAEVKRRRRAA